MFKSIFIKNLNTQYILINNLLVKVKYLRNLNSDLCKNFKLFKLYT